jgi:hypothetical protein
MTAALNNLRRRIIGNTSCPSSLVQSHLLNCHNTCEGQLRQFSRAVENNHLSSAGDGKIIKLAFLIKTV